MEIGYEVYTWPAWKLADRVERLLGEEMEPSIGMNYLWADVHGVGIEIDPNWGWITFYWDEKNKAAQKIMGRLMAGIEVVE